MFQRAFFSNPVGLVYAVLFLAPSEAVVCQEGGAVPDNVFSCERKEASRPRFVLGVSPPKSIQLRDFKYVRSNNIYMATLVVVRSALLPERWSKLPVSPRQLPANLQVFETLQNKV